MERVFNFSAGPSAIPEEVLQEAQRDLFNYPGAGCSVLEMSHRSASFQSIIDEAEATLRRIMNIPEEYAVLFMQGGATLQFAAVPMNLAARGQKACYALTGQFSTKAMEEGKKWVDPIIVSSSKDKTFSYIPKIDPEAIPEDAAYLHICANNTIFGTTYWNLPEHGNVPLVADWSSAILGVEIDVKKHDLIYAGAQKNMGPSGMAVVIAKKSLIDREIDPVVPVMLSYKTAMDNGSMYNTPPCFSIYMAGLMAKWVEKEGGVAEMERRNREKAGMLYEVIDNSKIFSNPVAEDSRSITNVTFTLPTQEDTEAFLKMAKNRGMINLKGHRSVGGCRASMYNGMPIEGTKALVQCIKDFEAGKRE